MAAKSDGATRNRPAMISLGRFAYSEQQRDLWRSGELPKLWLARYPELALVITLDTADRAP